MEHKLKQMKFSFRLVFSLALTFTFVAFSGTELLAQRKGKAAKSAKNRKKASRKAAEAALEWQGQTETSPVVPTDTASYFSENESEWEAFGQDSSMTTDMLPVLEPNQKVGESGEIEEGSESVKEVPVVLSAEEIAAEREAELKQARRKLNKKSPTYIRDLAKINFQEAYPNANQLMEPPGSEEIIFTFWTEKGPAIARYDEKGEWVATITLLNNHQLPAKLYRFIGELEMEVKQFKDKFRIESRELPRPVYALYTSQRDLVEDSMLVDEKGDLLPHIVAGLSVMAEGKHFIQGSAIHEVMPDKLSFLSIVMAADGYAAAEKDIEVLLEEEMFLFPRHYNLMNWNPAGAWSDSKKDWYKCPDWEPEYSRWYPEADWFVETVW